MTSEKKQDYTLRIAQANKSELVVILYEMLMDYLNEARDAKKEENRDAFRIGIRRAEGCLRELMSSLHLEYQPAGNLFRLYIFSMKELAKADLHNRTEEIDSVYQIMEKLHQAYQEISKKDSSAPIMGNTQTVYTGLTYGKNQQLRNLENDGNLRGLCI